VNGANVYRRWRWAGDRMFSAALRSSFAELGERSLIQRPARLDGTKRIAIGAHVFVGAGSWLQVLDEASGEGPALRIGSDSSIAGACAIIAAASVRVGRSVLFARNVYVSDHNHAYRDLARPVLAQGIDSVAPVVIEDGTWLGQNVVVCPGVRIGAGAVIAANSVVKSDVPSHCLAAGAPARVVREFDPAAIVHTGATVA
jgi:carbonic anhydrase/acetyltransferase-like protein (isoleucine patch superfamily)